MDVIAFAFDLGVAGFDVFGVVIVLLLLASRVSKRRIVLFASIALCRDSRSWYGCGGAVG